MKKGIFRFPTELGILECDCVFEIEINVPMYFVYIELVSSSKELMLAIQETYNIHIENANERYGYAMIKKCFQIECDEKKYNFIGGFIVEFKDNYIKIRADKKIDV
jgi:hypothetical protein